MISLPRHLAPWAAELALFPEEIALALGSIIFRLASVIGPGPVHPAAEGAPDGYDGVARRGSYDRLLPAEWLLLDELPDEFLRRVVAGEHSFLRRAHAQGVSGKRCLVLFDAGVEQLGAPRIAQLAILILLARRAVQQRATLEWGVLQDPASQRHTAVTEATVRALLQARSIRGVGPADIARWRALAQDPQVSESWWIGAEQLAAAATIDRASAIAISDVHEPGAPQRLCIRATSPRADRVREAILDVPPERIAIQLLRDPFFTAVAPRPATTSTPKLDVRSNLVFSPDGRRLYVRGLDSTLVTLQVPNSPRAPSVPPVAVAAPERHAIVAVGRRLPARRALVLTHDGQNAFVHTLSKRGTSIVSTEQFSAHEYVWPAAASSELRPLVTFGPRYYFIDRNGDLIEFEEHEGLGRYILVREKTAAVACKAFKDRLVWVSLRDGEPRLMWARGTTAGAFASESLSAPDLPPCDGSQRVHIGGGVTRQFAYAVEPSSWLVVRPNQLIRFGVDDRCTVVGMAEHGYNPEPCLITLNDAARELAVQSRTASQTIVTTAARITCVEVSATGNEIGFLTESGEIGVYSCVARSIVMRMGGDAAP